MRKKMKMVRFVPTTRTKTKHKTKATRLVSATKTHKLAPSQQKTKKANCQGSRKRRRIKKKKMRSGQQTMRIELHRRGPAQEPLDSWLNWSLKALKRCSLAAQ